MRSVLSSLIQLTAIVLDSTINPRDGQAARQGDM
jgi:hypothetical protein